MVTAESPSVLAVEVEQVSATVEVANEWASAMAMEAVVAEALEGRGYSWEVRHAAMSMGVV